MFQPLNLFKSINCPSFTQTSNTITCDRPYCQFKHPKTSTAPPVASSVPVVTKNDNIANKPAAEYSTPSTSNVDSDSNPEGIAKQLPDILENLTNALQSVQKLISTSNIGVDLRDLASAATSTENPNKINSSLATLTTAINSLSSSKTPQPIESKSPINKTNNLKRQQLNAPVYNPTPIKDLKNIKKSQSDSDSDIEEITPKRQKKSNTTDIQPQLKRSNETPNNVQKQDNNRITKTEKKTEMKSETKPKTDVVTFAKLTLSQQVQKRYEMLNKTPPTPISLAEARLKKMQASLGGTSKNSATGSKSASNVPQRVPKLIIDNTSKIPLPMRQRYLLVIFENGRGTLPTLDKACEKAAEQEKSIYDRAKNKTIYTNLAANLIRGLRTAQQAAAQAIGKSGAMSLKNEPKKTNVQSQSHEAMLNGAKATKCSFSINRVKQVEAHDLSAHELYRMFCTYIMSEDHLDTHSFPRFMEQDSLAKLAMIPNFQSKSSAPANKLDEAKKQHAQKMALKQEPNMITKLCKRCSRTFMLSARELKYLSVNSECVHHWGKLRNVRVDKSVVQKYMCCNGGPNETGCEVGKHVYEGCYDGEGTGMNLTGYVETKESTSEKRKTSKNIYALDCEMCYTARGLEVTRVSVVDIHMKEVYESLVKPDTQILDYNTRWSGLTEKILRNCDKSLKDVQEELLKLFNKDTILIGHSLDSDFKSLKLVHRKVVDTSVVFPHKLGLPYKRALRMLMSEHLQKIIQEDVQGHDSKEDANSCIELLMWKINEDLKNPSKLAIAKGKEGSISQFSTAKSKSSINYSISPHKKGVI